MKPQRATLRWAASLLLVVWAGWTGFAQTVTVPNRPGSVKFAVIGDSGDGDPQQFQVADLMLKFHETFGFDRVIMLGDNIYGGQGAKDLEKKFAIPYKKLLDAGVKFYASLGNHDDPSHDTYPLWNMNGQKYYSHAIKNVRFFALDSNQVDPTELAWIEAELKAAKEDWKICYFHHPLYSDGRTHGSEVEVRVMFEPLFVKYGVNVVFSGHDHIYERIKPQKGIVYFVSGAAGELRRGDVRASAMTAASFDQDQSFMIVEVAGNDMTFQAISRTGKIVDSGVIHREPRP
jgi:predicted MPP superfamily phosphohydrolase